MQYSSAYQAGRSIDFKVVMPLSSATPREYITGFAIENRRSGTLIDSATFGNTLSYQSYIYVWNGLNAAGTQPADSAAFAVTVKETSPTGTYPFTYDVLLSHWNAKKLGLGGWLPSNLMHYDVLAKRVYSADGSYRNLEAKAYGTSQLYIASEDGSEVYIFDANGNHLFTKMGLLGTNKFAFNYDSSGRLSSINEPFAKTTTFNRNSSGVLTSITAPNGQVTTVGIDSNGYLASITNPNSEAYSFTYYGTGGLMYTFQKPNGEVSTFEYTADGLLTKDTHSGGYFFELVKNINNSVTYDFSITTGMARTSTLQTTMGTDGSVSRTEVSPAGDSSSVSYSPNSTGYSRSDSSFGTSTTLTASFDQRYGNMTTSPSNMTISPYGAGARSIDSSDSVTLADPNDPFSISAMSRTQQLSGANTSVTTVFDPTTKKFTSTTYMGKTREVGIDTYERPVSFKTGSLNQTTLGYTNENLTSIVQGTRTTALAYNSLGLLQSVTDPLSQVTGYTYNSANRLVSKVLPDSRVIGFAYDAVGNITGVTPPSRPLHSFGMNAHGLVGSYEPPTLSGVSTVNTTYTYNLDKQLISVIRPSGEYINYNYNATTGVLESYDTTAGNFVQYMDSTTQLPNSITTPANISMNIGYVGRTPANYYTYVNGTSVGSYSSTYGTNLHFESDVVTSGGSGSTTSSITYLYNDDEDLRKAGDVVLTYNVPSGQLTGTTMGTGTTGFTDTYTYNTYGEVTGYTAKRGTATIYDLVLTRDGSGRVSGKTQTMNSITNDFIYGFDSSGRLQQVTKNSVVDSNYGYDSNSNRNSGNVGLKRRQPPTITKIVC
ncbi:MAG: RHS repeat protein [Bdellovibrio sp.]|nr:RHS repeat protein [Bdellovibrio sp.]